MLNKRGRRGEKQKRRCRLRPHTDETSRPRERVCIERGRFTMRDIKAERLERFEVKDKLALRSAAYEI